MVSEMWFTNQQFFFLRLLYVIEIEKYILTSLKYNVGLSMEGVTNLAQKRKMLTMPDPGQ